MKITELLEESTKISKRHRESTRGLHVYSDAERWNSDYTHYRIMMAAACTDGKTEPEMDTSSWYGKSKTAHPYSDVDQEKLKIAYKIAKADYKDLNHGDLDSEELDTINKSSPVPKKKKNKYGV